MEARLSRCVETASALLRNREGQFMRESILVVSRCHSIVDACLWAESVACLSLRLCCATLRRAVL